MAQFQHQRFTTPGADTFNVPTGVTMVFVSMTGAGGAGGGFPGTGGGGVSLGGGGAGEYCLRYPYQVTSGGTVPVVVGAKGVGTSSAGGDGGLSSFGTIQCQGGFGCLGGTTASAAIGGAGGGAAGATAAGSGVRGVRGTYCAPYHTGGSGGGGGQQVTAPTKGGPCINGYFGGEGAFPKGGGGGASPWGDGGDGGVSSGGTGVSAAATAYGAGGGGGGQPSGGSDTTFGGDGADGMVEVFWIE